MTGTDDDIARQRLIDRFAWKKVTAPKTWQPKLAGEELVGFYMGRTLKTGRWGQYEVVQVLVPGQASGGEGGGGMFLASGTQLIQLLDAAMISVGHAVRIGYYGLKETGTKGEDGAPRRMKTFEVYISEGPATEAFVETVAGIPVAQ